MLRRLAQVYDFTLSAVAWGAFVLGLLLVLAKDASIALDTPQRVRAHIRETEFDFVDWTLGALGFKLRQASVGEQPYLANEARAQLVRDYIDLVGQLQEIERSIATQFADPSLAHPLQATAALRQEETALRQEVGRLQPLAEAILQEQVSVILAEHGLVVGGQPLPPVLFHFTPLPYALIVSPRSVIRQEANLDVSGDLTLDEQVALEDRIARELDVSTLIVPLGGIGTYPTMVAQSSDLHWVASVTAHEWVHNYLTLRPLGMNYLTTGELRTMNETTATLVGNVIGRLVIARYYPDLQPPPAPFKNILRRDEAAEAPAAPGFDFRAEMRTTRVVTDGLLAEGKIEEAEAYMETRRRFFWDHGYQIRKLNQAYFAFHGAYADAGGAPGADPVGPAVILLWRRSPDLKAFLDTMAGFTSFEQLQVYLGLSS